MTASPSTTDMDVSREFLRSVRGWCVDKVDPRAGEIDRNGAFFSDLVKEAAELGLQSLLIGDEDRIDLQYLSLAGDSTAIIAASSSAVANAVTIARLHSYLLLRYASDEMVERWVPGLVDGTGFGSFSITEPNAGTDVRAITTVAEADGDGYRISGDKAWITQAPVADFSIVLAKMGSRDRTAPTAVFVVPLDANGITVGAEEHVSGLRGMPIGSISLQDVFVPESARLDGDGFAIMMDGVNLARLDAAALAVGLLEGAIADASLYATQRHAFGKPIGDLQAIQLKIGAASTDLAAAKALLAVAERSFSAADKGDRPNWVLYSQAKFFAADAAMRHTIEMLQVFGAYGLDLNTRIQRLVRDAKVTQIFDGTSEVLSTMIGQATIKRAAQ